jgi:hypothetical protein
MVGERGIWLAPMHADTTLAKTIMAVEAEGRCPWWMEGSIGMMEGSIGMMEGSIGMMEGRRNTNTNTSRMRTFNSL